MDYAREHELLLPAVREAGAAVLRYFIAKNYDIQHKDAENPVTEADFAANRILRAALTRYFPNDAILSEESDSEAERQAMNRRFGTHRVWIIDPIDGTREFIRGRDEFAISLGLVEDHTAVFGFICNPARNYLLSGGPSVGLFRDGKSIGIPQREIVNAEKTIPPRICVSHSEFKRGDLAHLEKYYPNLAQSAIGSIAYKLALVADGSYDLVVSVKPKNEWDIAGGAALMAAAGLSLYDGNSVLLPFNKENTISQGLVGGTRAACDWYQALVLSGSAK